MKLSYRNYVFDLYGTLVDIQTDEDDPVLWQQLSALFRARGLRCSPAALRRKWLRACRQAARTREQQLRDSGIPGPAEPDLLPVWQSIFFRQNVRFSDSELLAFSWLFRRLSTRRLSLYGGAEELIASLRRKGCRLYLLTNAQACFTVPELRLLKLSGRFDRVFFSSCEGVKKPSPAFFDCLRQEGLDPTETVMIGNDSLCDCRAASDWGMDSFYIHTAQSPGRLPLPENCREIASLRELLPE